MSRGRKNLAVTIVKPAPGGLRIVQELLNTADFRVKTDALASPSALAEWLAARELVARGTTLSEDDLRRALDVREGLRALAAANNGVALDKDAIGRLGRALRGVGFELVFEPGGLGRFVPPSRTCEAALGRIAGVAAAAQLEGTWRRFKACAHDACHGAFYDFSRNLSGKWCSARRCGNQLSARAYRRRQPS
jgi:predicted RNA-binding Zn ribbon-like protein